jgi:hypothetical protein
LAALAAVGVDVAAAQRQQLPVVVVPGLELEDLEPLAQRGAVGLLVPAAGPRASQRAAEAALVRGELRNSFRGGLPEGRVLISFLRRDRPPPGPAIVLGLPRGADQPNTRRYPIAVIGPRFRGLLESDETRIAGLVSIVDVAPTALGAEGALESRPAEDQLARLRELDGRIEETNTHRALWSLVVWVAITLLALILPRAAVLAFPSALAANLALGAAGISDELAVAAVFGLATACAAPLSALVIRSPTAIALACTGSVAAYLIAFAVDGRWLALSPLGPTQNARFYGLSNLLETFLLVPALVGAALLGRRHWSLFAAVAALSFVVVAGSRFGADGGGAVVLAAGYAVLAVALAKARWRTLVLAAAGAVAAVTALLVVDELTGASSHVTRTVRGGPVDIADALGDRVVLSWERATDRVLTALIVSLALVALALLLVRLLGLESSARRAALPLSVAGAIGMSVIVNDSPLDVAVTGLVAYIAVEAYALPEISWAGGAARWLSAPRGPAESRADPARPRPPVRAPGCPAAGARPSPSRDPSRSRSPRSDR